MLWTCWDGCAELGDGFCDISWHGHVDSTCLIIPMKSEAAIEERNLFDSKIVVYSNTSLVTVSNVFT
jgi:hypothetical protein